MMRIKLGYFFKQDFLGMNMAIRVFRCSDCGHRMRLTGDTCGYCHAPKLPHQRLEFWVVLLVLLAIGFALYMALT